MPFDRIPVIDLADIKSSDTNLRHALAKQVRNACINVGFFYVKNHGISEDVISETVNMSAQFFNLPSESKMKVDNKQTTNFKGYAPLRDRNKNGKRSGRLHEAFQFGWEVIEKETEEVRGEEMDGVMTGANIWPTDVPNFREAMLRYYHAGVQLGKLLLPIFALALELPEDYFADKTRNSAAMMSILHYPPQTGDDIDDPFIGIGSHTDFECFTILWQQPGLQALQVLNSDDKWIDVPPREGTLVINIGDQLARWTNDVFKSTVHRALNYKGVRRYSIPLFFGTDYNVKLEPIPTCVSSTRPPKYDVVTAGEHVKSKLQALYGKKSQ
ncbi:hypothetical protein AMATHDRAFT_155895 [Amanita thiersii Skay4041]|uniref:Fe2OG dioxygenase domain-containing protein n=1 Tax=Amanita thiersii Skay4041 TaxID=703135 RepID=A0A2A9ND90_9AGAR|nr:hypothetical protein AMATHDRAFT_155895 [Amanita thiersii Skay4041]